MDQVRPLVAAQPAQEMEQQVRHRIGDILGDPREQALADVMNAIPRLPDQIIFRAMPPPQNFIQQNMVANMALQDGEEDEIDHEEEVVANVPEPRIAHIPEPRFAHLLQLPRQQHNPPFGEFMAHLREQRIHQRRNERFQRMFENLRRLQQEAGPDADSDSDTDSDEDDVERRPPLRGERIPGRVEEEADHRRMIDAGALEREGNEIDRLPETLRNVSFEGRETVNNEMTLLEFRLAQIRRHGGPALLSEENLDHLKRIIQMDLRFHPKWDKIKRILHQLHEYLERHFPRFPNRREPRSHRYDPTAVPRRSNLVRPDLTALPPRPNGPIARPVRDHPGVGEHDNFMGFLRNYMGQRREPASLPRLLPESRELYLPAVNKDKVQQWTKTEVMRWVRKFIVDRDQLQLIESKGYTGSQLYQLFVFDEPNAANLPYGVYIRMKMHINRVVNSSNGYSAPVFN